MRDWTRAYKLPALLAEIVEDAVVLGKAFPVSDINRHDLVFVFHNSFFKK
jgi:hypothetical protein